MPFKIIDIMRLSQLSDTHFVPLTDLHYQLSDDLITHGETNLIATPVRLNQLFALAEPEQSELAIQTWAQCMQRLKQLGCKLVVFSLKLRAYVNQQNEIILCDRQEFLSPDKQRFTQTPAITLSCGVIIRGEIFEASFTYAVDYPFIMLANRVAMIWISSYLGTRMPFPWARIEELAK